MSASQVILLQDSKGDIYAIPLDKLQDARLKSDSHEVQSAMDNLSKGEYSLLGLATMPQSVRKAAYATPNVMTNVHVPMPTA